MRWQAAPRQGEPASAAMAGMAPPGTGLPLHAVSILTERPDSCICLFCYKRGSLTFGLYHGLLQVQAPGPMKDGCGPPHIRACRILCMPMKIPLPHGRSLALGTYIVWVETAGALCCAVLRCVTAWVLHAVPAGRGGRSHPPCRRALSRLPHLRRAVGARVAARQERRQDPVLPGRQALFRDQGRGA